MATKKKEDALVLKIRDMRKEIKKKVEDELLTKFKEAQEQGKYPWEGMWLRPQEIEKLQKRLKWKDRIVFVEVIILFFLLSGLSYGLYRLMLMLFIPR